MQVRNHITAIGVKSLSVKIDKRVKSKKSSKNTVMLHMN